MTSYLDHVFFINNLSQALVRWLMAANKRKKKKIKIEIINNFCCSKNQTKTAVNESIELQTYIGRLVLKWQPRPSFQRMIFLTPHGYKRNLRANLKSNWSQIFTRFNREIEAFSTSNFMAIFPSPYWWRHQICQTKYTFDHKLEDSWMCAKDQLLGVWAGGQLLLLLNCLKVGR